MKRLQRFRINIVGYAIIALVSGAIILTAIFTFAKPTELNIYTWEDYIAPDVVAQFEQKYNVAVTIHEFDSVFDLVRAYRENPDLDTYDLIFFTDSVGEELHQHNILSRIEENQVPNIKYIASTLLTTRVNAKGLRAVPYMFGTTGIVYNKKYIDPATVNWSSFWDEQYRAVSCLLNDESDVIAAAAFMYNFDAVPTNDVAMRDVTAMINTYTSRGGMFCSDVALVDELVSERIWIAQDWNGSAVPALEGNPELAYMIPKSGGQLWYDVMAIPRGARNVRNATLFINFLNQPKIAAENVTYLMYASANDAAREYIDKEILANEVIYPATSSRSRLHSSADYPYYEAVAAMRDEVSEIMQRGRHIE